VTSPQNNNESPNSTGNKLLWWVLGALGAFSLFVFQQVIFDRIKEHDTRLRELEIGQIALKGKAEITDKLATETRAEQLVRINSIHELQNKLNALDIQQKIIEDRTKTISERILTMQQRLDRYGPANQEPPIRREQLPDIQEYIRQGTPQQAQAPSE